MRGRSCASTDEPVSLERDLSRLPPGRDPPAASIATLQTIATTLGIEQPNQLFRAVAHRPFTLDALWEATVPQLESGDIDQLAHLLAARTWCELSAPPAPTLRHLTGEVTQRGRCSTARLLVIARWWLRLVSPERLADPLLAPDPNRRRLVAKPLEEGTCVRAVSRAFGIPLAPQVLQAWMTEPAVCATFASLIEEVDGHVLATPARAVALAADAGTSRWPPLTLQRSGRNDHGVQQVIRIFADLQVPRTHLLVAWFDDLLRTH
jgi:hypothetical protein